MEVTKWLKLFRLACHALVTARVCRPRIEACPVSCDSVPRSGRDDASDTGSSWEITPAWPTTRRH